MKPEREESWLLIVFLVIFGGLAFWVEATKPPPTPQELTARAAEAQAWHEKVQAGTVNGVYCGCVMCGDYPCGFCIMTCDLLDTAAQNFEALFPYFPAILAISAVLWLVQYFWRKWKARKNPAEAG